MPAQQSKVDFGNLDKRIGEVQKNLAFVGQNANLEASELFKIIHHPGWTTPQQVEIANQILDAMHQQAGAMRGLRNALEAHVKEGATQG
jgi:hypothetical protein